MPTVRPLQQYLPFTVLKRDSETLQASEVEYVATVLTVYGIETGEYLVRLSKPLPMLQQYLPFTVLKLLLSRFSSM